MPESPEQKGLVEKIGIGEVFAYLLPGAILLVFNCILYADQLSELPRNKLPESNIILAGIGLTLAYASGLTLRGFVTFAKNRYESTSWYMVRRSANLRPRHRAVIDLLVLALFGIFFYVPKRASSMVASVREVEARLNISRAASEQTRFSIRLEHCDFLAFYRATFPQEIVSRYLPAFAQAESLNRRNQFAWSMATAFTAIALQILVQCALNRPHGWVVLALMAGIASLVLRMVAQELRAQELALTNFIYFATSENHRPATDNSAGAPV